MIHVGSGRRHWSILWQSVAAARSTLCIRSGDVVHPRHPRRRWGIKAIWEVPAIPWTTSPNVHKMSFSLSEFTSFSITVPTTDACKAVTIHGVKSSSSSPFRPPLLCLHGFPQTHHMWFKVAPFLAERFTVVATDLRGYGESSKPEDDGTHELYSKRSMANDQVDIMCGLSRSIRSRDL